MHQDRREFPRVEQTGPVEIIGADSAVIRTRMDNISRSGLQIVCDRKTAEAIAAASKDPAAGVRRALDIRAWLLSEQLPAPVVEATARVVYARDGDDGRIRIGLKFATYKGDSFQVLMDYIIECLR